ILAHIGREEVAGVRDLVLVTQEKPAARKDLLQLLLVNLGLDENAPADEPAFAIYKTTNSHSHTILLGAYLVVPAKPGTQGRSIRRCWAPAFAGGRGNLAFARPSFPFAPRARRNFGPARGVHQLRPAAVELPVITFADAEIAGPSLEVAIEALMTQPHLRV